MEENKRSIKGIKKGLMLAGLVAMTALTAVGCGKDKKEEKQTTKQEQVQEEVETETEVEEAYEIENRLEEELQETKGVNKELIDIANEFRFKIGPCIDSNNQLAKKIAYELIAQEAVRYPQNLSDLDVDRYIYETYVSSNADNNSFKIEDFRMAGFVTKEGTNICVLHEGEVFKQDFIAQDGTLYALTPDSETYGPYLEAMQVMAVPCLIEDPEKEDMNIPLISGTSIGMEEKQEREENSGKVEGVQEKYPDLENGALIEQLKQDVLKAEEDPNILIDVTNEYRKRFGCIAGDRNFEDSLADLLLSYQLVVAPTDEEVDRNGQIEYVRNAYVVGDSVDIREMKVTKEKIDGAIHYYNAIGADLINHTIITNGIVYPNQSNDISMRSIVRINKEGVSCVGQTIAPEVEIQGEER